MKATTLFDCSAKETAFNPRRLRSKCGSKVKGELAFSIDDDNDPIEIDGQTTYVVSLSNSGTRGRRRRTSHDRSTQGGANSTGQRPRRLQRNPAGDRLRTIAQMRAKDRQLFRFSVQHTQPGVHVVRALVKSKLRPIAVVNEESTEVYRDRLE